MKLPIAILAAASLAACGNISPPRGGDYADAGSTALAVANGAVEGNPIIGFAGDGAAPVVALVGKVAVRTVIDSVDITEEERENAHHVVSTIGWGVSCNNIAVAVSNVNLPTGLLLAGGCGAVYNHFNHPQ